MTYEDLFKQLENLTESQLKTDVTVAILSDTETHPEYYKISEELKFTETCDVLDENHPILELNN